MMAMDPVARVFLCVALVAPGPGAAAREAPSQPELARVESIVVARTNEFRREEGRSALAGHAKLTTAAREFALFMARTGKYSHEADGRTPRERIEAHGYRWCMVAENISYQFSSTGFATGELASRLVDGWKRSADHRANMLDRDAVHTAVAVARSPRTGYFYAVQLFAGPRTGGRC